MEGHSKAAGYLQELSKCGSCIWISGSVLDWFLKWANFGLSLPGRNYSPLPRTNSQIDLFQKSNLWPTNNSKLPPAFDNPSTPTVPTGWSACNNYRHRRTGTNGIIFGEVRSSRLHEFTNDEIVGHKAVHPMFH